jgi:hypothetical protein
MAIIIKEISIRTVIERNAAADGNTDRKLARMRRDIVREMNEMLRRQRQKKGDR